MWERKAIEAAIKGDWKLAVELNQKILTASPTNVASLNRLAKAFWEIDNIPQAKKAYQKALELDFNNPIALKNLKKLNLYTKNFNRQGRKKISGGLFLKEPGKTKTVKLVRLNESKVLAAVSSGDKVQLIPKRRFISVNREDGIYLGSLPEDLSHHLAILINSGNKYQAYVLTTDEQNLEIFIRGNLSFV